jgi:hypothetical protein
VDVLNEQQSSVVDNRILQETVHRVNEHPSPQLLYQWAALSKAEKLILASLATLLNTPNDYASSERVSHVLESLAEEDRQDLDLLRTRVQLEGLRRRRILDRDQTRYRFTMDLIRRWVQTEHSVWDVLGETSARDAPSPTT